MQLESIYVIFAWEELFTFFPATNSWLSYSIMFSMYSLYYFIFIIEIDLYTFHMCPFLWLLVIMSHGLKWLQTEHGYYSDMQVDALLWKLNSKTLITTYGV